jgi:hypothetical protein
VLLCAAHEAARRPATSTPHAYDFTSDAALTALMRIRTGVQARGPPARERRKVAPLRATPSTALGSTFAACLEGVVMQLS